jgi:hypothetical protein
MPSAPSPRGARQSTTARMRWNQRLGNASESRGCPAPCRRDAHRGQRKSMSRVPPARGTGVATVHRHARAITKSAIAVAVATEARFRQVEARGGPPRRSRPDCQPSPPRRPDARRPIHAIGPRNRICFISPRASLAAGTAAMRRRAALSSDWARRPAAARPASPPAALVMPKLHSTRRSTLPSAARSAPRCQTDGCGMETAATARRVSTSNASSGVRRHAIPNAGHRREPTRGNRDNQDRGIEPHG